MTHLQRFFGENGPALIAFDLDGTLVDSARDLAVTIDRLLLELGRPPAGEAAVRGWVGNGAEMLVRRALANSAAPEVVNAVSEVVWSPALTRFQSLYQEENGRSACLYPGVKETLTALSQQQKPMVVITNKPRVFAEPLLNQLGIAPYFALLLGGECLPRKKPDPMPLLHACRYFSVKPQACLMVGDSRNDVQAAQAAGYVSAALTYGYNHGEPVSACHPDWLLDGFHELLD